MTTLDRDTAEASRAAQAYLDKREDKREGGPGLLGVIGLIAVVVLAAAVIAAAVIAAAVIAAAAWWQA